VSAKQAIDDPQGPIASLRKIVIVGHDNKSFLAFAGQAEKQVHNRVAGLGIEIAGWFVGENDVGIIR
jgi:hypothetical protein